MQRSATQRKRDTVLDELHGKKNLPNLLGAEVRVVVEPVNHSRESVEEAEQKVNAMTIAEGSKLAEELVPHDKLDVNFLWARPNAIADNLKASVVQRHGAPRAGTCRVIARHGLSKNFKEKKRSLPTLPAVARRGEQ